jgi:hypothetical protein
LRNLLAGRDLPLILAATDPLASIFRIVNTYPALAAEGITTSPDRIADHELASAARHVLDRIYAAEVEAARGLYQTRLGQMRATVDVVQAARAASMGAIELLMVDIDHVLPGTLDEAEGRVSYASEAGAASYDLVDAIASLAILSGAKILGVRKDDIPDHAPLAAILRYPV